MLSPPPTLKSVCNTVMSVVAAGKELVSSAMSPRPGSKRPAPAPFSPSQFFYREEDDQQVMAPAAKPEALPSAAHAEPKGASVGGGNTSSRRHDATTRQAGVNERSGGKAARVAAAAAAAPLLPPSFTFRRGHGDEQRTTPSSSAATSSSRAAKVKPSSSSSTTSSALAHGGFRRAEDRAIFDDCDPEAPPMVSVGAPRKKMRPSLARPPTPLPALQVSGLFRKLEQQVHARIAGFLPGRDRLAMRLAARWAARPYVSTMEGLRLRVPRPAAIGAPPSSDDDDEPSRPAFARRWKGGGGSKAGQKEAIVASLLATVQSGCLQLHMGDAWVMAQAMRLLGSLKMPQLQAITYKPEEGPHVPPLGSDQSGPVDGLCLNIQSGRLRQLRAIDLRGAELGANLQLVRALECGELRHLHHLRLQGLASPPRNANMLVNCLEQRRGLCDPLSSLVINCWHQYIPGGLADHRAPTSALRSLLLQTDACSRLCELSLGHLSGNDLPVLLDYLQDPRAQSLRRLCLHFLPHEHVDPTPLAALLTSDSFQALALDSLVLCGGLALDDTAADLLGTWVELTSPCLRELVLSGGRGILRPSGVDRLLQLARQGYQQCPQVEVLCLDTTDDAKAEALGALPPLTHSLRQGAFPHLRTLRVALTDRCPSTDIAALLSALTAGQAPCASTLLFLSLSCASAATSLSLLQGLASLEAGSSFCPRLTHLALQQQDDGDDGGLGEEAALHLVQALLNNTTHLVKLDLSRFPLCPDAQQDLAKALSSTCLCPCLRLLLLHQPSHASLTTSYSFSTSASFLDASPSLGAGQPIAGPFDDVAALNHSRKQVMGERYTELEVIKGPRRPRGPFEFI